MALDFPNSPTDGQVYTDTATSEQWVYESATNSWTSKGLVNTSGGLVYKGTVDITAAPPAGVSSGWQYSVLADGTANAGYGPGITGTVAKGDIIMYTGTGWTDTSHNVPQATAAVAGIDKKLWKRSGTTLSPETAGDAVDIDFPLGTAALPGLTPVGDPNTGVWAPAADTVAVSTNGSERLRVTSDGKLGLGTSSPLGTVSIGNYANNSGQVSTVYIAGDNVNSNGAFGTLFFRNSDQSGGSTASIRGERESTNFATALTFYTQPTVSAGDGIERLRIDNQGNVGIGTQAPASKVEVRDSNDVTLAIIKTGVGAIKYGVDSDNFIDYTDKVLAFRYGGSEKARLDQLGKLLVGTSTAVAKSAAKLQCASTANLAGVGVYADNTAAKAGGLVAGDVYRKADGTLMITF